MTEKQVAIYEKIFYQFNEFHSELSVLSKKSPNDGVNKFKLKFANQLLTDANELLRESHKPFEDFEVFDVDDVPTNSDVVLIFSQYITCLEKLKYDFVQMVNNEWQWVTEDNKNIKTARPSLNRRF